MGRDGFPWYRKDKRCWYVWCQGRQVRLAADKGEAFRRWHGLGSPQEEKGGGTVGQLVDAYLAHAEKALRPKTAASKREFLLPLKADWPKRPAGAVSADDVRAWIVGHATWGVSRRWLAGLVIRAAFRWAGHQLPSLGLPAARSRGRECLIKEEDHDRLVGIAPEGIREALLFLHATGCRPGELCRLTAGDIDLGLGVGVLTEHKTSSGGRPRVVVLGEAAKAILRPLIEHHPAGPLFRNSAGSALTVNYLGCWMNRACGRLSLPGLTPYGYRHTFATDALARGTPDAIVAQLLGHQGTAMLHRHYSHLTERLDALKRAAEGVRPNGPHEARPADEAGEG